MAGMDGFMNKFGGNKNYKPTSSFSSYEDPKAEHEGDLKTFMGTFRNEFERYVFHFKNADGTTSEVELRFDKEKHSYTRVEIDPLTGLCIEIKVPGITSVVGIKDKSMALMPWAANETANYVKAAFLDIPDEGMDLITKSPLHLQEWLFDSLEEARKNYQELSKQATDIGHAVHDWLESYIKAKIAKDDVRTVVLLGERNNLPEKAISCCEAALAWMRAHNVRWSRCEDKIYSREFDCAGTFDGVCLCDSCDDPDCCPTSFKDVLSLVDWKSSNALYDGYRWQTAAYQKFLKEVFGLDILHRWLVQLGKFDGEFKTWHIYEEDFQMDFDCFAACLTLTKTTDHANRTLVDRRAAARKAKREARELAEAIEKAEKKRCREGRTAARAQAKFMYRELRRLQSVATATAMSDSWLALELAKFGPPEPDELTEEKAA